MRLAEVFLYCTFFVNETVRHVMLLDLKNVYF